MFTHNSIRVRLLKGKRWKKPFTARDVMTQLNMSKTGVWLALDSMRRKGEAKVNENVWPFQWTVK